MNERKKKGEMDKRLERKREAIKQVIWKRMHFEILLFVINAKKKKTKKKKNNEKQLNNIKMLL